MKYKILNLSIAIIFSAILLNSCKKDDPDPVAVVDPQDVELYQGAVATAGNVWYKKDATILNKASNSGHSDPKLRVRFNSTAAVKLDTAGKVISGSIFDSNSLVTKELYDASGTLLRYAVMCKAPSSPNADAYGWVWGVYRANGDVEHSATLKGSGCTGCHNGVVGNIDLTTMNVSHP